MCNQSPEHETRPLQISPGAAMAHGCCGGFRPPQAPTSITPAETKTHHHCQGSCKTGDDQRPESPPPAPEGQ